MVSPWGSWDVGPDHRSPRQWRAGLGQSVTQGRPTPDPESPLRSPHTSGSAAQPPGREETPGCSAPPSSTCPGCSQHRGWWVQGPRLALLDLVPFWQVPWALGPRDHGAPAGDLRPLLGCPRCSQLALGLRPLLGHPLAVQGLRQVTLAIAPAQGSHGAPELSVDSGCTRYTRRAASVSSNVVLEQDTEKGSPRA